MYCACLSASTCLLSLLALALLAWITARISFCQYHWPSDNFGGNFDLTIFKMTMKINPPLFKSEIKSYDRYKQELLAWKEVTEVAATKQAVAVALSLPENDTTRIREKVFDEIPLMDLKAEGGFDRLVAFLDEKLKKDELEDCLERFELFEDYQRADDEKISQYIANFDQKYQRIVTKGMKLPSEILAFKLLKRAKITHDEKLLVMTGMDYAQKATLYEQARKSLQKFKGGAVASGGVGSSSPSIKLEPAFLAEHEEALWSAGYVQRGGRWRGNRGGGFRGFARGGSTGYGSTYNRGTYNTYRGGYQAQAANRRGTSTGGTSTGRAINPSGSDGQPLTCRACGSYRHMIRECPDSWENMNMAKVNITDSRNSQYISEEEEHVVLFTGFDKQAVSQLGVEARQCAVLDSACSSTVCGQNWLDNYLECLTVADKLKVIHKEGSRMFRFGGGTVLRSLAEYEIPAVLAGKEITIATDVVASDIPLLLSRTAMKNAKIKLDLVDDTAEIFGKSLALNMTTSGHYCVPIDKMDVLDVESVFAVDLGAMSGSQREKVLLKLHRQFAHPSENRLIALLKDAGVWCDDYRETIACIQERCDLCKLYAKTPSRPVVAMPQAKFFNEKVAMDLKHWKDEWILHMIDMWSRLTISSFIQRKTPRSVIDKVMSEWIGVFGVMEAIMTDNGGEFSSDETREVASILNVVVCTSAGESPFQNGLCERVHAITDTMLLKLQADNPTTQLNILLRWANMARNSLQMWHGYSSHQLVFGVNPNLPNIMNCNVPALEGSTSSETFAKHLNALHSARHAFIRSEADERIQRALRFAS